MTTPDTTIVDNETDARFELHLDSEVAGYVTYRRSGGIVSLDHTEIDQRFGGRGLGSTLAGGVLDRVRSNGETVLPFCEFIQHYLTRHPERVDLVPKHRRDEFGLGGVARTGTTRGDQR